MISDWVCSGQFGSNWPNPHKLPPLPATPLYLFIYLFIYLFPSFDTKHLHIQSQRFHPIYSWAVNI
ncbi:MAG: hypothetical protein N7Q72_07095, partial [Spiroplasma sp. Tabriz.8]|nr:hypothetical protein [Spiroplasma sp. Tabriz.8]